MPLVQLLGFFSGFFMASPGVLPRGFPGKSLRTGCSSLLEVAPVLVSVSATSARSLASGQDLVTKRNGWILRTFLANSLAQKHAKPKVSDCFTSPI